MCRKGNKVLYLQTSFYFIKEILKWVSSIYFQLCNTTSEVHVEHSLFILTEMHCLSLLLSFSKMKNRFTTIDLMAVIHDLKPLIGYKVINIYDMNSKTYLIKLQR